MSTTIPLTHKGWFGICPVYFGNLHSEAPLIVERHWSLLPLMLLSEAMFGLVFLVGSFFTGFEPTWPLRVTGELKQPKAIAAPEGDRS